MNRREFVQRLGTLAVGTSAYARNGAADPRYQTPARGTPRPDTLGFHLVDVTRAAGLQFRHHNGADGGKLLPETLGSGCAFLDYDADGRLTQARGSDGSTATYTYDAQGRLTSVSATSGDATSRKIATVAYAYHERLVTEIRQDGLYRRHACACARDLRGRS